MAESAAQRKANLAYRRKNVKQLNVSLYPDDADLIEWLDGMTNKQAYIRGLIRADMEANRNKG